MQSHARITLKHNTSDNASRWDWVVRDLQGTGPLALAMMVGLSGGIAVLLQYIAVFAGSDVGMAILSLIPIIPAAAGLLYAKLIRPVIRAIVKFSIPRVQLASSQLPTLEVTFPRSAFPADAPPPRTHSA